MTTSLITSTQPQIAWTMTGSNEKEATAETMELSSVPVRIGRPPDVELSLISSVVSARHAELIETAGLLSVRDLGSTNETYVNGRRISEDTLLSEGDWIEVSDLHLRVDSRTAGHRNSMDQPFLKTQFIKLEAARKSANGFNELFPRRALGACFQPIHYIADRDISGY